MRRLLLAALAVALLAPGAQAAVVGEERVLVVLVTWGPQPFTQEQVRDVVFRQANDFFRASSYGRMHLAGDVTPWLNALSPSVGCDVSAIRRGGRAGAAALGYDRSAYGEVVYVHPDVGCAWSGIAEGVVTFLDGELFLKLVTHELGHTFGLGHANSTACGEGCATEYGDPYDTMGSGTGDFNAYEKYRLGWLSDDEIAYATRTKDYVLDELEADSAGKHALVVRTHLDEYWIENRRDPARTVEGEVAGPPGVLVRTGTPQGKQAPGVTDLTAYNRLIADPARGGRPALLPGDRYSLRGTFSVQFVSRRSGRALLQFAWTDRTPPGRVRGLQLSDSEFGLGPGAHLGRSGRKRERRRVVPGLARQGAAARGAPRPGRLERLLPRRAARQLSHGQDRGRRPRRQPRPSGNHTVPHELSKSTVDWRFGTAAPPGCTNLPVRRASVRKTERP